MKNINWLDHFANLLVVILGITIAFYLEGYKEEKANRNKEKEYIESLLVDLEADIEALDTLRELNQMISKAVVALANASVGVEYEDGRKLRNDVLFIQYNPPFVAQRTSYESMKSSGHIDGISDFELRKSIIELYEQFYRGTDQYDGALSEHVSDYIKPFCMKYVRFTNAGTVEDDFLRKIEFQNMIFSFRYLFAAKDNFYGQVLDQVKEVKSKLEEHLASLS